MTQTKKPQNADKDQSQRFIDMARELEANEDEKAFKDKLKRIAKPKPGKPEGE